MHNKFFKILSICLLFFFIQHKAVANSNNLTWYTDFNKALEAAQATNKPMLLFFTGSDWCGWCKKLQAEVFYKDTFKKWAAGKVILVELDFPRQKKLDPKIQEQNNALQTQLGVRGYPMIYFIDQAKVNGKIQLSILGSMGYEQGGPDSWVKNAQQIIQLKKK